MIQGLMRLTRLEDMDIIPIVVSPTTSPFNAAQTLLRRQEELEDTKFSVHIPKLRLLYSDMLPTQHGFQYIHPDGFLAEVKAHDPTNQENTIRWMLKGETRHMLKFISRVVPLEDNPSLIYTLPQEVSPAELLNSQEAVVAFLMEIGNSEEISRQVKVIQPNGSPQKFRYFFTSGDTLVEVVTKPGMTRQEITARIKEVRDWWLLQKLSH